MAFVVTNIINGNTFQVSNWKLGDKGSGNKVRILGLEIPIQDPSFSTIAVNRLKSLVLGKEVELLNPSSILVDSATGENILLCRVLLNTVDVVNYFPELKQKMGS